MTIKASTVMDDGNVRHEANLTDAHKRLAVEVDNLLSLILACYIPGDLLDEAKHAVNFLKSLDNYYKDLNNE